MQLTDAIDPPSEPCLPAGSTVGFAAPAQFVDPANELRLIPVLREAAKTQNPYKILARAAEAFYWVAHPTASAPQPTSVALGNALADLAVTGRVSYRRLGSVGLQEASLREVTRARLASVVQADPGDVATAVGIALDRAYAVAWALRGPVAQRAAARAPLGWIAVSGEDDKPHRPVNVEPPPFEQFEVPVTVGALTVRTRFFIASAVEDGAGGAIAALPRALPPDPAPGIPAGHRVILFLHGHSSGAEEALGIITHLHKAGRDLGTKYAVVSFDLPNNGYSESFDHAKVAPSSATTYPRGIFGDPTPIRTPILDYTEAFVAAFVDALDAAVAIKHRFAGVIGGSLGGNLGLRLGRRDLTGSPWLEAGIVSWSAASVWDPMVRDLFKQQGPDRCLQRWGEAETDTSRVSYFSEVFDQKIHDVIMPHTQPDLWFRDGWEPCKAQHIAGSRIARREIYDANFRRWHWRLAGEQLIYSHVDRVDHHDAASPLRFTLNRVRHLLVAGHADNFTGTNIFDATRTLSKLMVDTPGRSLFLNDTGHSMHLERPRFFAGEIASFLSAPGTPPERRGTDVSFLTPLLLSGPG